MNTVNKGCLGATAGVLVAVIIIVLVFLFSAVIDMPIEDAEYLMLLLIGGGFLGAVWALLPQSSDNHKGDK